MNILLGFLPFLAFAIVDAVSSTTAGLIAGGVVAVAMLVRGVLAGKSLKLLEVGTVVLFCGLAAYTLILSPNLSLWVVRVLVDLGLFVIVLISIAVGRPFTLQYAREMVDPSLWQSPQFRQINFVITSGWAIAFAAMVLADLVLAYVPQVPRGVGVVVTVIALVGAIKFTNWYPQHRRAVLASQKS